MSFVEKLHAAAEANDSLVCIGLDIDPARFPSSILGASDPLFAFNKAIIDATLDVVCAFKLNLAFYEALGLEGMEALKCTADYIPSDIPVILDAKISDVGHSARLYARAVFDVWGFDGVTVNPYLGGDAVAPFLEYADKGIFVLTRTSNPGAGDFQDLYYEGKPLYLAVAGKAKGWNVAGNCGLVVGATYPKELKAVRAVAQEMIFLVAGIGAQGGDLSAAVSYGTTVQGIGPIISSSRAIIYASKDADFASSARQVADDLRREISLYREKAR